MIDLIACLSTGKGTWGHVSRLIQDGDWEKIFLITNEFGKENFTPEKPLEFIIVNSAQPIQELVKNLESQLKDKINSEVALNIVSGTGKEHMAILSALLKLGVGVRLTALTNSGVQEI